MAKSTYVLVRYDSELAEITSETESPMVLFGDATFEDLLKDIFLEFPEIDALYKPGELGFLVNGIPPKEATSLGNGDVVEISAHKK